MKLDLTKLATDVREAMDQALVEVLASNPEDRGSCNFDSLFIPVGKDCPIQRNSKALGEAITALGGFWAGGRRRGYIIPPKGNRWQGNPRSLLAEIAAKQLPQYDASVWYQVD